MKDISYGYADPAGQAAAGVPPARAMGYYFVGDTLVGYEFISTFREDATDFDDARAQDLRPGATTEAQVRALLGRPAGMYVFPLTRRQGDRALVYMMYGLSQGSRALARKHLVVVVDPAGVVSEVQLDKPGDGP